MYINYLICFKNIYNIIQFFNLYVYIYIYIYIHIYIISLYYIHSVHVTIINYYIIILNTNKINFLFYKKKLKTPGCFLEMLFWFLKKHEFYYFLF